MQRKYTVYQYSLVCPSHRSLYPTINTPVRYHGIN